MAVRTEVHTQCPHCKKEMIISDLDSSKDSSRIMELVTKGMLCETCYPLYYYDE